MLRLIGILIGSALAIGLLIVTLGVPQLSDPEPDLVGGGHAGDPVGASELANAPLPEPAPEPAGGGHAGDSAPAPDTEALIEQIFSPEPVEASSAVTEPAPVPEPVLEDNWYAFWSPFRSELAANGFVSKLQETTGIDYRVVKVKTGVYEVAFAYSDDADVQEKLARISAATGLDMSGG